MSDTTNDPFAAAVFTPYVKWYRTKAKISGTPKTAPTYQQSYHNSQEEAMDAVESFKTSGLKVEYIFLSRANVIDAEGTLSIENVMFRAPAKGQTDWTTERRLNETVTAADRKPVNEENRRPANENSLAGAL